MLRAIVGLVVLLVSAVPAVSVAAGWQVFLGGDDDATPREPSGVAVDSQGAVFVADKGNDRIQVLRP